MFNPKGNVWDRLVQTFSVFKDNFFPLLIPLFLYNFIVIVIFGTLFKYFMINKIWNISIRGTDILSFLSDPFVGMIIIVTSILFILYLILYIPVFIWLIKSINQSVWNEKINMIENFKFWFTRLLGSLKTYWFIFAYVALIPSLIFIFWWVFINLSFYVESLSFLNSIWIILISVSLILFIYYSLYRWIKTSFSIITAISYDKFDKNNFLNSLKITDNNWWRIIWNILLLWIIISIISWIISSIISIFMFSISFDFSVTDELMNWFTNWNLNITDMLNKLINAFTSSFSITWSLISWFIKNIINTIWSVFIIVFMFIFFKRLEYENNSWK